MTKLLFSKIAYEDLQSLHDDSSKKKILKAVLKTLGYMETNLRHPSLSTHIFHTLKGPNGEKVFEAYVQQSTPGAYRIFWYYGPGKDVISIISIVLHP